MSGESAEIIPKSKVRLKFIDMGRSIAILLMLEGHFIEHTFKDFKVMAGAVREHGTSGNLAFDWFYFIKGFTAPIFFAVTGVIFVYLLARNKDAGYFRNPRVKKGFRRVLELLFWGYLLQLNLRYSSEYIHGDFGDWVSAFHVLQCIGIGIAFLLIIYGLYKLINIGPLYIYYFIAGTAIFCLYPGIKMLPADVFIPEHAPNLIQNMIKGPDSVFPIIPWTAFTVYGGMIGALIVRFHDHVTKLWFPLIFIAIGIILNVWARPIFLSIDGIVEYFGILKNSEFVQNAWLYGRFGQVIIALGVLILVEKYFVIKAKLFLKVGQNTLPIYILHVMVLYAGFIGYGLKSTPISHALNGWQTILGAAIFIGVFVVFIKYFEFFDGLKTQFMNLFRRKRKEKVVED
ncbi:MAG: putative membrane protein [Crocinitomicaceae bacterium]|jgi:uncharacterized membrane protein